jgi:hypothetical protein
MTTVQGEKSLRREGLKSADSKSVSGPSAKLTSPGVRQGVRHARTMRHSSARLFNHRLDRVETKIDKQLPQPRLRLVQISIMTELPECPCSEPGLVRIDFPRMQVEDDGPALETVDSVNTPTGPCVGENPEVSPPGNGKVQWTEARGGTRHFHECARGPFDRLRDPVGHGDSIAIVPDRENARIVFVSFLEQHVERPQRARRD